MSPISRVAAGAWPITPLGDVCQVVTGSTPPRGESRYFGGSVPWIKPEDLDTSLYVVGSKEYLTDDGARLARRVPKGSVLVSCIGKIGKVAIAGVDLAVNQQINCLVPGPRVVSEYLYYAMRFEQGNLQDQASNTIVPILNKSRFAAVGIPLPPLADQQRIVAKLDEQMAALDRADMALAAQQAVARAFKRATLQTTLDQATHPEWKCTTLGELCTFANGLWTGKKPPFQQASVIRNTNFTSDCTLDFSDIAHLDVEERQLRSRRLRAGDIILERSGGGPKQPVGRVALFELDDESYSFSNFTSVIRVNERNRVLPRFLWYYLFHLHNSGATEALQNHTSGIRNLDFSSYVLLSIPVPTLDEQRRIVDHLDRSIEQTNNLLSYVAGQTLTLVSLRNSFLEAAFSGEV